jgi:predicted nucleic acid-binding protein
LKTGVLDSYALISFLERVDGYDHMSKLFEECIARDRELLMCIVNWGEIVYHALRIGGDASAQIVEDTMRALPIQLVDANKDLTSIAAKIKAATNMQFGDCFVVALAKKKKCEVITGDKEFKKVEKEIKIHWL